MLFFFETNILLRTDISIHINLNISFFQLRISWGNNNLVAIQIMGIKLGKQSCCCLSNSSNNENLVIVVVANSAILFPTPHLSLINIKLNKMAFLNTSRIRVTEWSWTWIRTSSHSSITQDERLPYSNIYIKLKKLRAEAPLLKL
jgi:hypothetical protein